MWVSARLKPGGNLHIGWGDWDLGALAALLN